MKKPNLLIALILATGLAAVPVAASQELQSGTWTGTATPPDGNTIDLAYTVASGDEGLSITIQVPEVGMSIETYEVKLEGDKLSFGFAVEVDVLRCELVRQDDGSFAGECVDDGGSPGYLVMNPPGA